MKSTRRVFGENDRAIADLTAAIASGTSIALLGAGASVAAGYPTWSALLLEMESRAAESDRLGPKYVQKLKNLPDPLWRADEYRQRMGESAYLRFVARTFRPNARRPGPGLEALARLPFRHFITTNYDTALERTYERIHRGARADSFDWADGERVGEFLSRLSDPDFPPRFVHLHGTFDSAESIVLTERDYVARYLAGDTRRKLFAIFATHRVVFIGFSLTDPELMPLLREVRASLGPKVARHFAVMSTRGDAVDRRITRDHFEKKFGVRPVFYPETDDHRYLASLLRTIVAVVGSAPTRVKLGPSETAPAGPKRFAPARRLAKRKPAARVTGEMFTDFREREATTADPEDSQKGRFGGRSAANGRRLVATVKRLPKSRGWFRVSLAVERSQAAAPPLTGTVEFHLHETFAESVRSRTARGGRATTSVDAYGAFTVGAVADAGATRLELDLSRLASAPKEFREA